MLFHLPRHCIRSPVSTSLLRLSETAIHAPRDGPVKRLPVKAGAQVEAKDLLAEVG